MRNLVAFMHISLDGYAAGPTGELDWVAYDQELEKYAETVVSTVGTALYGRVTYHMMEYWRTVLANPASTQHEIDHAHWIEAIPKVVVSTTLKSVDWNNTRIIAGNLAEEILKLKQQPGKDIVIFGSPSLTRTLAELGLIDQYQLTLNPVLLGSGMPFFATLPQKSQLQLLFVKTFGSGAMGLHYKVVQ